MLVNVDYFLYIVVAELVEVELFCSVFVVGFLFDLVVGGVLVFEWYIEILVGFGLIDVYVRL